MQNSVPIQLSNCKMNELKIRFGTLTFQYPCGPPRDRNDRLSVVQVSEDREMEFRRAFGS